MRRRGRADILKLVLPLPLVALLMVAAYFGTRRGWERSPQVFWGTRPPTRDHTARSRVPESAQEAPAVTRTEERHTQSAPPAVAEFLPETRDAAVSPTPRRLLTENDLLSGPALDKVTPSYEAALRASEPPPAAASAPSPVPAPAIPLVPAPEPRAAPYVARPQMVTPQTQSWQPGAVRAVRFDAGYYYDRRLSARQLAERLTESWADQGVNLVYFYAYNKVYGARYHTNYPGNIMEDYGRQDLLGEVIRQAHHRGIKVIAWINGVEHKQMWEAHPDWRQKTKDGADYKPDGDSYLLCVRNPEVMQWWLGLVDDLLTRYPDLDGIDMAEFQVDRWGDHTCYCEHCTDQFHDTHPGQPAPGEKWREFRADGLTRLLAATGRLAHGHEMESHVTTVFTAGRGGNLMSSGQVRDATGFDLEGVLTSGSRPDVIQAELIWQQWAALYDDQSTFTADWTGEAVSAAKRMVQGRARLIAHVEVTDFGCGSLDGPSLGRTIAAAVQGRPYGIDIYDSYQLERTKDAPGRLRVAWLGPGI